jgi:hypothetical protein
MSKVRLALSIRQPFAELILRRRKPFEYRSIKTHVRERVYIYASKAKSSERVWRESGFEEGDLPTGVLVGTVELAACHARKYGFAWKLVAPKRAKRLLKPKRQPQPVWFCPFGE